MIDAAKAHQRLPELLRCQRDLEEAIGIAERARAEGRWDRRSARLLRDAHAQLDELKAAIAAGGRHVERR